MNDPCRIWCIEIGEPLPVGGQERLVRYGLILPGLVAAGYEVTWFASSFVHQTKSALPNGTSEIAHDGVAIKLIDGLGYRSNTSPRRIAHHARFARALLVRSRTEGDVDLIIVSNPTPDNLRVACQIADEKQAALVVDIRDSWPDDVVAAIPTSVGRAVGRLVLSPYYRWTRHALVQAEMVIASSTAQLAYGGDLVGHVLSNARVIHHPYKAAGLSADAARRAKELLEDKGVDFSKKIVAFAGTIGRYFALEDPILAMSELDDRDVQLIIAGTGDARERYEQLAANHAPPGSCVFVGWLDRDELAMLMRGASVGLAPYKDIEGVGNKIAEYSANGMSTLTSLPGETMELLATYECGQQYSLGDVDSYLAGLEVLLRSEASSRAGGRALYVDHFSVESAVTAFGEVITAARQLRSER